MTVLAARKRKQAKPPGRKGAKPGGNGRARKSPAAKADDPVFEHVQRGIMPAAESFLARHEVPDREFHRLMRWIEDSEGPVQMTLSEWRRLAAKLKPKGRNGKAPKEAPPENRGLIRRPPPMPLVLAIDPTAPLSEPERERLNELEQSVEAHVRSFVEAGLALNAIRKQRLHREAHATFEAYCQSRWNFGRAYAYRLIDSANVVRQIGQSPPAKGRASPIGDKLPLNEAQARPLTRIEPEQRAKVWQQAVRRAERAHLPQPTAAIVAEAVEEAIGGPSKATKAQRHKGTKPAGNGAPIVLPARRHRPGSLPKLWNGKPLRYAIGLHQLRLLLLEFKGRAPDDLEFHRDLAGLLREMANGISRRWLRSLAPN